MAGDCQLYRSSTMAERIVSGTRVLGDGTFSCLDRRGFEPSNSFTLANLRGRNSFKRGLRCPSAAVAHV